MRAVVMIIMIGIMILIPLITNLLQTPPPPSLLVPTEVFSLATAEMKRGGGDAEDAT